MFMQNNTRWVYEKTFMMRNVVSGCHVERSETSNFV